MKIKVVFLSLFLIFAASSAHALGPLDVELEAGAWFAGISGDVRNGAMNIDVDKELGLGGETTGFVRARLDVAVIGNFYLGYTPLKYEGTGVLGDDFGGIPVGRPVNTDLDVDTIDLGWTFTLLDLPVVDLELGLNVKYAKGTASITDITTSLTEKSNLSFPIPMIKGVVRVEVPFVTVEVDGMGLAFDSYHAFDLMAQAKLTPLPFVYLAGGYRYMDIKLEDNAEKVAVAFQGPFVALGLEF